jgi:hypothetical protein
MSLVKKPEMTEKKVTANRRNQHLCNVPMTEERRERIGAALLRFGFEAQAEEIALRALGEDPAYFQELLDVLWEEWNPAGGLQEGVVISLGRALWLMNRAARMQEGYAVRQAQDINIGRQDRLHVQMMRLKMTAKNLQALARSVATEHYVTPPDDLEKMKTLHQSGALKEMGEFALDLFYQLQPPGTGEDGIDPQEQSRRALMRIKEIFGLSGDTPPPPQRAPNPGQLQDCQQGAGASGQGVAPASSRPQGNQQNACADVAPDFSPVPADLKVGATKAPADPSQHPELALNRVKGQALKVSAPQPEKNVVKYPKITPAEWEARERARHLLENILRRQVEICEAQRKAILKESLTGPSPYERAAEIAPTHPNARVMRRMQDANFREIRRLTSLLLKIKRYERQMAAIEKTAACQDISENKEVSSEEQKSCENL